MVTPMAGPTIKFLLGKLWSGAARQGGRRERERERKWKEYCFRFGGLQMDWFGLVEGFSSFPLPMSGLQPDQWEWRDCGLEYE